MRLLLCLLLPLVLLAGCSSAGDPGDGQGNPINLTTSETPPPTVSPTPLPTPTETPAPTEEPTPEPTPAEQRLIRAQTTILDTSDARMHNIRLCAQKLNGTLIEPGADFSFNQTIGPRTAERGYQIAPVIVEKRKEMGHGGGVCQVSSTLYIAARDYGLTITERHEHGKPSAYTKPGDDAAVSYGGYDLRFHNNTDKLLKIKTSVGKYVTVSLYQVNE